MKLEPCVGCGRMILSQSIANLTVKCDPTPLTDVGEIVGLLTSPNPPSLWMVENGRLRGARPGEPGPVREHRCVTVSGANPAPSVPAPPKAAPRPAESRVAPRTPSSVRPTAHSGAPAAAIPRSEPCDRCRKPVILDGPELYVSFELGATVVYAAHETCP